MNYNTDIVYEIAFIDLHMDEGITYHTKTCSFMWTYKDCHATTYFMSFHKTDTTLIDYYVVSGGEVKSYMSDASSEFNQEAAFSAFVSA